MKRLFVIIVAISTIYRFISPGLKWNFGFLPTLSAFSREQLPLLSWSCSAASVAFCLPCLPAGWTPLGLISITFGLVELLLFCRESESGTTIGTLKGFILKRHWWPPLLDSWSLGHHYSRTYSSPYLITQTETIESIISQTSWACNTM